MNIASEPFEILCIYMILEIGIKGQFGHLNITKSISSVPKRDNPYF